MPGRRLQLQQQQRRQQQRRQQPRSPQQEQQANDAARKGPPRRRLLPTTSGSKSGTYSSLAGVGVTSQAYSPHQQWVVLRSLATNTFVSVEPPPHEDAMIVHGRGESISLNNVFGFLRGGFLWAKSTVSLLNVCSTDDEICTGFLEAPTEPHLKRLQRPMESAMFEFHTVAPPPPSPPPPTPRRKHA